MKSLPKLYNVANLDNGHIAIHYRKYNHWFSTFTIVIFSFILGMLIAAAANTIISVERHPLVIIIILTLSIICSFIWMARNLMWQSAVVEIHPQHSISFGHFTLKQEDIGKIWVQSSINRQYWGVLASSNGQEVTIAGPVATMILAETLGYEIQKALNR